MTDRYWRKIEDVENDIENAMQISGILLKLKGYDDKLGELSNIDTNTNNISSNSGQISTNTDNISTNSGQISTNTSSISTNSGKIDDNINAIKLINKNSQDNSKDISTNSNLISSNTLSISTNSGKIDNFTQYILKSGKDFEEKYIIENQIFRFNRDKHFYTLFEKEIEFDFTKNSLLFVKNNIYYKYDDLSNDYHRLQHEYNIYDDENNLIHKYLFNKDTYYDESLDPILHTNEDFCICFKKNYNKIKINLQLHRHNRHGVGNINLEIDDDNESYINVDYIDRNNNNNNEKVDTNSADILSNLGKINTNRETISSNSRQISTNTSSIASNLSKINDITNSIILKNVYNFLPFYDYDDYDADNEKNRIPVNRLSFTKTFKMNIKKNDFIEMNLRMFLEYETLDDAHIVDTQIKFFDDDERIYFIPYRNGNFLAYDKFVFLNNNIIYHFEKDTKSLKIEIRFQYNSKVFSLGVDKIWQISRHTIDRCILKHYGGSI